MGIFDQMSQLPPWLLGAGAGVASAPFPGMGPAMGGLASLAGQARQMLPGQNAQAAAAPYWGSPASGGAGGMSPIPPPNPAMNPAGRTDVPFQYPNAAGAPVAAPPAGAGGGTGSRGDLDPLNLIQNPRTGVLLELQRRGISPYSGDPIVNALLKRAGDITNTVVPGLRGSADPVATLLGGLSSAIDRAFSGQSVFNGASGAGGAMSALEGARDAVAGGGGSLGDAILANIARDPTVLAKLVSDLQYAGQGSAFSGVGGEILGNQASLYEQNRIQNPQNTATNFLDAILQGRLPSFTRGEQPSLAPGRY